MLDRPSEPAALPDHADLLSTLASADAVWLKALAEALLPGLGAVEVVQSRTGLVMMPMRDTVRGTDFRLGEVLVAEAHLRATGVEDHGMVVGRDLKRATAMAVVDAAAAAGVETSAIAACAAADHARPCAVAATRVDMETL